MALLQHLHKQNHQEQVDAPIKEQDLWDEAQRINQELAQMDWESFKPELEGEPITLFDAAVKYNISPATLRKWLHKGLIRVLDRGKRGVKYLNERDVAYLAEIYRIRQKEHTLSGRPLAQREGDRLRPYLLKHPTLSVYRRRRKARVAP